MRIIPYFPVFLCAFCSVSLQADEESATLVETATAIRADELTTELQLTGTVVSRRRSGLSSREEGLVKEVLVDAGSRVKKGEVLLTLDTRYAEIELDLILAEIEIVRVRLEDSRREREEVRELADLGGFAKSEASSRQAAVKIREAERKALAVRKEQQLERIERHRLVAPFSGTIARKGTEVGEWVETGATIFELVETDALWFDLQVAQEFLAAIQEVQKADLVLDAFPKKKLPAKIDVIVPVKDPVSRTFLTRLTFEDPAGLASPGMSGHAILQVRPSQSSSVSIPRDAVTRYPDGSAKVWVVRDEGGRPVARSVPVRTGGGLGKTVKIEEGLKGGEKVVVRGNEGLSDGQVVVARDRKADGAPASL